MARIAVSGYMLRHPMAGNVLAFLQYVLGLERLGHEVVYIEESGWPYSCYDPTSRSWRDEPTAGLQMVSSLLRRFGSKAPLVFVHHETGPIGDAVELQETLRSCDLLLDVGGVCWLPEFSLCRRRALVDMDPVFTQLGGFASAVLDTYDTRFSYATNIGRPDCGVPTADQSWSPTVPPVVADLWPVRPAAPGCFTTVANWGAYGSIDVEGSHFGQKDEEFEAIIDLPRLTPHCVELALAGGDAHVERLRSHGWRVRDAASVSGSYDDYVEYIAASIGEFSVAKHAYVVSRSGWISDRTVSYLAAGRPAVVQDTGVTRWFDGESGVVTFVDVADAAASLERVAADYERYSTAASRTARERFSYDVVLPELVDRAMAVDAVHG